MMYFLSLAFGYVLAFTQSTLIIGRSLSDSGSSTGYQDAITPPRFSMFALLVYTAILAGVIYGIWAFGWLVGLATAVGFFVIAGINQVVLLPKSNS